MIDIKSIIVPLLVFIITFILWNLFIYGLFVFVSLEPNFINWPQNQRFLFALLGFLLGFNISLITVNKIEKL